MTDRIDTAALRRAWEETTPGPWDLCAHLAHDNENGCPCGYRGVIFGPDEGAAMAICQPGHELPLREEEWGTEPGRYPRAQEIANMRFIALAHREWPALLDRIDALEAEVGRLREPMPPPPEQASEARG